MLNLVRVRGNDLFCDNLLMPDFKWVFGSRVVVISNVLVTVNLNGLGSKVDDKMNAIVGDRS